MTSSIIVVMFMLTEWLFGAFFSQASHAAGTLVNIGIALALGLSPRFIHERVDRWVDRLFFLKRHQREKALRDFGREAALITDYDTLLDGAMLEVEQNAETAQVAIYVRTSHGTYAPTRCTNGASRDVSENDRAILKLRASHEAIGLDHIDSALTGAQAYPMLYRGELIGILSCGRKLDGQPYAPDEAEELTILAHGVGMALGTLHAGQDGVEKVLTEIRDILREVRDALASAPARAH